MLKYLYSRSWFEMYRGRNPKRMLLYSALAIFLASIAILIDILFKYPKDTNVLFPQSLLFYPVMGYVAEILFHIIPFTLLVIVFKWVLKNYHIEKHIWLCMLIVALIEPIFQGVLSPRHFPLWIKVFMGCQLYTFNLLQLYSFKKHYFLSMYSVRQMYYLFWHILWGNLRLPILF
ncbi:MAG: hypothetical protein ACXAEX_14430 [Promethearchaeota archaeon]